MARIVWQSDGARHEYELLALTTIGRSSGNDIRIQDRLASSKHARIRRDGNDWILEDLKSTNGSLVNGEKRERCVLREGDVLHIGGLDLAFQFAPEDVVEASDSETAQQAPRLSADTETSVAGIKGLRASDAEVVRMGSVDSICAPDVSVPPSGEDTEMLARRLKVSYEISRAVTVTLDPAAVMEEVLAALLEIFESAQRAFIILVDPLMTVRKNGSFLWSTCRNSLHIAH